MSTDALRVSHARPPAAPAPEPALRIAQGHTMLLDHYLLQRCHGLAVQRGLVRVAVAVVAVADADPWDGFAGHAVTLGYLGSGDHLPLDLLRRSWLHLEALSPAVLVDASGGLPEVGATSLTDWTVALLTLRHLADAEQRLLALLQLLAERLGRRCGAWIDLPVPLTHGRMAELIGHTRVTVTRQLSRWRQAGLIATAGTVQGGLRFSPLLLERPRLGG